MLRSIRYGCVFLMCLTFAACQGGRVEPKRYPVSGTVKLDGQPLSDDGLIYFKTIATGAIDACNIKAGKYTGNVEAGDRRVEIVVFRVKTVDIDGMKGETQENLIPAKYNSESTLTAKVTTSGPNQFDFEVLTK